MIPQPDRKITDLLKPGTFTLSAEVIPPRNGSSQSSILKEIDCLTKSGAQFLAVTKGAGGSLRGGSLPIAQMIKESFRTPCIAHFTSRDLLPEEVENQLVDHHYFGIRNILALRGDPPQGDPNWQPRPGSYPYAYQLVQQIRALNEGRYLERKGFAVESRERTDFCVGVAVYPDHPIASERLEFFRIKVEAGAEFAITQMLFDPDSYERFLEDGVCAGLNIPVLPGTRLLKSQAQARRMAKRFQISMPESLIARLPEDDKKAHPDQALEVFYRLTEDFRSKGAPGLHLFVLTDIELAQIALRELGHVP